MQTENTQTTVISGSTDISSIEEVSASESINNKTAVLSAVFRSIFLDSPKNFFSGIGNFFKRYYIHYKTVIKFLHRPSLKATPFDKGDFKENSQLSFEIVLLLVAALLFMIKQSWVPVNKSLQETYGNDIAQMMMELVIFFMLASAYFVQLFLSVMAGRLVRSLFNIGVTRPESDVLSCFLNNSFFSLSALLAFFFRLGTQYDQIEGTDTERGIYVICFLIAFLLVSFWSVRFAKLNQLSSGKKVLFAPFSILLFTVLYGTGMAAICSFVLGT